ncbi:hypothetical protein DL765_001021 [Monosporascus sp. GIB2]|nr:hypothetical protein DL765_001021 [Monosporascus sp. GIB2]
MSTASSSHKSTWIKALAVLASGQLKLFEFPYTVGTNGLLEQKEEDAVISMGLGMSAKGDPLNMGGVLPDVRLWNANCEWIGRVQVQKLTRVRHGGMHETLIPIKTTQQPVWTLFSAHDDGVCIAYATMSFPDDSTYMWLGDWSKVCNRQWYYSNIYLFGTGHKPLCHWIDKDGQKQQTALNLHWPSFTFYSQDDVPKTEGAVQAYKDFVCDAAFHSRTDHEPTSLWCDENIEMPQEQGDLYRSGDAAKGDPPPGYNGNGKRETPHERTCERRSVAAAAAAKKRRNTRHDKSLVITADPAHSAEELCAHPSSRGPNLVNTVEGNYCHMSDKTLWPVCAGEEVADNCFDKDAQVLRTGGLSARDSQYDEIIDWTADQSQADRRESSDLPPEKKVTWRQWLGFSKRFLNPFSW